MLAWPTVLQMLSLPMDAPVDTWDYTNTTLWNENFALCAGPLQSPIDVTPPAGPPRVDQLQLEFAPGLASGEIKGFNTGRTIKLVFRPENLGAPIVTFTSMSRPLFGTYQYHETWLRWGEGADLPGSEHSVNGSFADAEAQLIFFNSKYGSFEEAAKHVGGLAIAAVLLNNNAKGVTAPEMPLFGLDVPLEELAEPGMSIFKTADLTPLEPFITKALSSFYLYYGSLTQPPCSPVVVWMVSTTRFNAEADFLLQLYSDIFADQGLNMALADNRRPIQSSKGRVIEHYKTAAKAV